MNDRIHPAIAALVIGLALLAVAIWVWAGGKASEYGGPAEMLTDPDGRLYIQVRNQLLEHDQHGNFLRRHDLGEIDTPTVIGGMAFASDGSLLLRRGADPRSFIDNLRAYRRATNTNSLDPVTPRSGLYRCDLQARDCISFASPPIDPRAVFSLAIDQDSGDVYLANTSRHRVLHFDSNGEPAGEPWTDFKFPNQLAFHDGKLYVADTNHHRMQVIEPNTNTAPEMIAVVPAEAHAARHRWPSRFARVGDHWWVNNMTRAMDYGGVYVFDEQWQYVRTVNLPPGSDPIAILPFGDDVLISDWYNDTVHVVSPDGYYVRPFQSEGLDAVILESVEQRFLYNVASYSGVALVIGVFLVLILKSVLNPSPPQEPPVPETEVRPADGDSFELLPDAELAEKLRRQLLIAAIGLVGVSAFFFVTWSNLPSDIQRWPAVAAFLAVVVVGYFAGGILRASFKTAIRIDGDIVTLRDHNGKESRSPLPSIRYTKNIIADDRIVIILRNHKTSFYRKEDIEERLLPRLAAIPEQSQWQMWKHMYELRHPQIIFTLVTMVAIGIAAGIMWMADIAGWGM